VAGAAAPVIPGKIDPDALSGGYRTVGKSGYELTIPGLKQLYTELTNSPTLNYVGDNINMPQQTLSQLLGGMPSQSAYFAKGGLVQHFADGDSVQTTTGGDGMSPEVAASLKALGSLDSGLKQPQHNVKQTGQMGASYSPKVLPQLAALLRSRGMNVQLAEGGQPNDREHPNYDGTPVFRTGGLDGLGGKYVEGKGDGTSDDISAMLANGEFVFSADVVSALGNGSNKAGADRLSDMVEAIRSRARSTAPDKLPPDAKSPLEYLKGKK